MKQLLSCFFIILLCTKGIAQNVGIGTTTPAYPLTVIGDAAYKGITQKNGTVELGFYTSAVSAYLQTWSAHDLNFATNNGVAKLTLANSNGYIGINNSNPASQLDLSGSLRIRGNGAGAGKVLTSDVDGVATWQDAPMFTLPYSATSSATSANNAQFEIVATGASDGVADFRITSAANISEALFVSTEGTGAAIRSNANGSGIAAWFTTGGVSNTNPTLYANTYGTGGAIKAQVMNSANNIALFSTNNGTVARINGVGKGFFNGGTQTGGADVAEAFAVTGNRQDYEPGDVLAISTDANRTVTKSNGAYSTLVVGVYATKPGVLLTERMENESQSDLVPMGVIGVIPTKVCTEGGIIHRGDLLVTSSIPGCAMKGDPTRIAPGMLLGKALEDFDGNGVGKLLVMVNVR